MKHIGLAIVCASLAACMDNSYNGIAPDGSSVYYEEDRLPVLLAIGIPDNIVVKGSGAIDYETGYPWTDKDIYFYCFKRDLSTSFTYTSRENPLYCLVDGSTDGANNLSGKVARKNALDTYLSWTGIERRVLYPNSNEPYDFYGYFIDDIQVKPEDVSRTHDSITINITIDGSQDIMSSVAELTDEQLYNADYSDEERLDIINYSFSSFTAKRNIHPTFIFKHHLARLRFALYPAIPDANHVYVDSIKVMSRDNGVFTVAHKSASRLGIDFSGDNEYKGLWLTETDGSKLQLDTYHSNYQGSYDGDVYDREGTMVGGSLLLAPDAYYEAHFFLKETTEDGSVINYENVLWLVLGDTNQGYAPPDPDYVPKAEFEPGMEYLVRLSVAGAREVEVSVTMQAWESGGDLVLDEDEIFEEEHK